MITQLALAVAGGLLSGVVVCVAAVRVWTFAKALIS